MGLQKHAAGTDFPMDRFASDDLPLADAAQAVNALLRSPSQKQVSGLIRTVLRGERPVSDLMGAGISPHDPAASPEAFAGITVRSADYAEGILNLRRDSAALMEWALFVIRVAEMFDYVPKDIACCERLMSYVWQISYGSGLSQRAITLATMVRNWPKQAA